STPGVRAWVNATRGYNVSRAPSRACGQARRRDSQGATRRPGALAAPESLRCQAGAFYQCLKLQLGDGRVQPTRAEAAVRPRNDIFAPDHRRVVADALCDQLWVLDRIGVVANDARDEDLARWQLDVLPEMPFVGVTRV